MEKFKCYDENGNVVFEKCKVHLGYELLHKGLGKDLSSVGLDEPIIFNTPRDEADLIIWGYTQAEMERRAFELGAEIKCMQLPPKSLSDADKYQFWFTKNKD